jgi:excisionase family DNA binding protein
MQTAQKRLTPQEAAALVPVSLSLLYEWVAEKRFEVTRAGRKGRRGKILIDEAVFRAFLDTLKVGPAAEPPAPKQKVRLQHLRVGGTPS